MWRALASLRTTLALLGLLVLLAALGSFAIQLRPDAYAAIEGSILVEWLRAQGLSGASWWVLAMIAATALLSLNACVCVGRSLARGLRRGSLPLRSLWAHAAHLGFLLVLLGHLIGSAWGFRSDGHPAFSGQSFQVPQRPGWSVRVGALSLELAPEGYPKSLSAPVTVRASGRAVGGGTASVNHPVFVEGAAVYLKEVRPSLRGWDIDPGTGRWTRIEVGVPVAVAGGTLLLGEWAQTRDGRPAVQLVWTPTGSRALGGWVVPSPGDALPLPSGPILKWGEMAVDALGTFDVRYDPGARLALVGGILLSVSLIPLLRPRRPAGVRSSDPPLARPPANSESTCDMAAS